MSGNKSGGGGGVLDPNTVVGRITAWTSTEKYGGMDEMKAACI